MIAAIGLAVAAGASATLLTPPPVAISPGNVAVPAVDTEFVDGDALQRRILEQLVTDAAVTDPTRLPSLTAVVAIHTAGADWVVTRLLEPDVPGALALAFADRLRRGVESDDRHADRLLGPLLRVGPSDLRRAAVDSLRGRGRLVLERFGECGCTVGVHPSAENPTVFVQGVGEGGVVWRAEPTNTKLVLHVHPEAEGPPMLAMALPPDVDAIEAVTPSGAMLTLGVPKNR